MKRVSLIVIVCLAAAIGFALRTQVAESGNEPPVFDKRPYAEARKAAEDTKKWFIVKATAVWCGPCKRMDKTTWRDEKIVKWLEESAIVVAVDVDEHADLAKELAISAMPTMIAFKDGAEFDRVVGYRGPAEFLGWLEGIAKGEKSIEATRKRAGERDPAYGHVDVQARYTLARELVQAGKLDEATDEFAWLWQHALEHEPAMYGVRLSFMKGEIENLARKHEPAKTRFIDIRDETGKLIEGEKVDPNDVIDWITLNAMVADDARTLEWFTKVKSEQRWKPLLARASLMLEPLLIAEKRWADLPLLYPDPNQPIESYGQMLAMNEQMGEQLGSPEERADINESMRHMYRERLAALYAGLLAGKREEEATAFATKVREVDGDADAGMLRALVETALTAEQARPVHVEWLAKARGAEPKHASEISDLQARVERAIKPTP